ncbi:hypothetical protein MHW47_01955 [Streptomyces sp. OfavH-34-F]|uniref:SCO4225 family membrane protein n=1 Tax=unclassified Streptomyces TaxID=2593676 RepID=UPI001EF1A6B4|nr:hypothetical protein [Streptomyces sp. OfavH-34-F]MCG7523219.1 hypothetical protein [Streptomyces sp. OfavH-34-F]
MHARALLRLTFGNLASAIYLGIVGATVVFEVAAATIGDPGMVGVWTFLVTAPTSLFFAMLCEAIWGVSDTSVWYLGVAVALSALIQAFILGALTETVRGRLRRPAAG